MDRIMLLLRRVLVLIEAYQTCYVGSDGVEFGESFYVGRVFVAHAFGDSEKPVKGDVVVVRDADSDFDVWNASPGKVSADGGW